MNSQISFTLGDLGMLVLWILAVTALILLSMVLFKAYNLIKNAMDIVEDNRIHVDKVIKEAPELTSNVNVILGEVAHGTKAFRSTVDNVAETADTITKPFKEDTPLLERLAWIINTMQAIFYHKDKKSNTAKRFTSKDEFSKNRAAKNNPQSSDSSSKASTFEKAKDLSSKAAETIAGRNVDVAEEDWEDDLK